MPDDLKKKILGWLDDHGYPFEMTVARAFQDADFTVRQSINYVDPDTEKTREMDVSASITSRVGEYRLTMEFLISCKATSKPWIVFTSPTTNVFMGVFRRKASDAGRLLLLNFLDGESPALEFFQYPSRVGYSATEALRSSDNDAAYGALCGLAQALEGLLKNFKPLYDYKSDGHGDFTKLTRSLLILVGVVIVDHPVFECYLDENDKLVLEEIDWTTILWQKEPIYIVSSRALKTFAAEAAKSANEFFAGAAPLTTGLDEALKNYRENQRAREEE